MPLAGAGRLMELKPGTRVTDKVVLVRPLSKGAMGAVWVATHETLDTEVAVKFIIEEFYSRRADALERFKREATAAARIKSPHVVQMLDHGVTQDGTPYIVMELMEGESLADRIKREGPLTPKEAAQVVTHVCRALTAAHKLGVIHRDIKPQNIFITEIHGELFAKVLDFGIAKHTDRRSGEELTEPGTLVGTPEYLSRDLIAKKGAQADDQLDLWAVAVVAYKCLTGEIPFSGETLALVLAALAIGEFAPPSQHRPELHPRYDRWFKRAFHERVERRFASAEDLAMSFQAVVDPAAAPWDQRETQAQPSLRVVAPQRRLARLPVVLVAIGGLALGAVLAFGVYKKWPRSMALARADVAVTEDSAARSAPSPVEPSAAPVPAPPADPEASDAGPLPGGEDEVYVPAGVVHLGCRDDNPDCAADERPAKDVDVAAFFIDRYEVRVSDFELCVRDRGCNASGLSGFALSGGRFGLSKQCNWRRDERSDHPLNCVTQGQALAYCQWAKKRLPSEVEWERAARGDDTRVFPWGDEAPSCERTVMGGCGGEGTAPVAAQPADRGPFGTIGMAGNVREWVADWYSEDQYRNLVPSKPSGPGSGSERVARGGSWGNAVGRFLRVSARDHYGPETRSVHLGFRCARSVE
jgi:formylglycine-generating enzyme required for sulfatase activity/tRNA A-37 threonylcarbamoyl transferase component Bud32